RADNAHVAFGYGAHFCVGAPLARLEGQLAIAAAVRRLGDLAPVPGDLTWLPSMVFRRVRSLPVTFTPSRRTGYAPSPLPSISRNSRSVTRSNSPHTPSRATRSSPSGGSTTLNPSTWTRPRPRPRSTEA